MTSADTRSGLANSARANELVLEESDLLASVGNGDRREPMEELCHRYSRRIFALGMQMLGDRGMAEEMVQDTFVRLWKSAPNFDPSIASPKTFIYTLARRSAIDIARRKSSRPTETGDEVSERLTDTAGEQQFDQVLLGIDVRDAIDTLSEKHRETINLCYGEDMTQAQIAETMGVPLGTVKTRIHHALSALRIEMEGRDLLA